MNLHDYSGFSRRPTEEQEHPMSDQSSRGPTSGYFVATLQQGKPSGSDEGRKMVQRNAPSRPSTSGTSSRKLTQDRASGGRGRVRDDLILLC